MQLNRGGVRLVEIIVVLVIMVIVVSMAIASFGSYHTLKLDAAAQAVVSDIRYVQQLSMADTNQRYVLDFDVNADTYRVMTWDGSEWVFINHPFEQEDFLIDFNQGPHRGVDIVSADFDNQPFLGFRGFLGRPRIATGGAGTYTIGAPLPAEGQIVLGYRGRSREIFVTRTTGKAGIR